MYILLALITACALGIAVHYLAPHREVRASAIAPAITTAASAVIYTVMQWAGVGEDSVWIWLASVLGAAVIGAASTTALSIARSRADQAQRTALGL